MPQACAVWRSCCYHGANRPQPPPPLLRDLNTRTQHTRIQHHTATPQYHSQVFYHLGELDSALTYALGAGRRFDVTDDSEYVRTLVGESFRLCRWLG